jgi:hypothetical protein
MDSGSPGSEKDSLSSNNTIIWGAEPPIIETKFGRFRSFNGSTNYGLLPSTLHITPKGAISLRMATTGQGDYSLVGKDSEGAHGNHRILLFGGTVIFQVYNGASLIINLNTGGPVAADGLPHNIVATWGDGANLYCDGKLYAHSDSNAYDDNPSNIAIGVNMYQVSTKVWYYAGSMWDIRIFNLVPSARAVKDIMFNQRGMWASPANSPLYLPEYAKQRRSLSPLGTRTASRQGY